MKEIDKEYNPEEINSKDETFYQASTEQKFSSNDSIFSSNFSRLIFSPSLETANFSQNQKDENSSPYTKENILMTFNNQKSTKQLQKSLTEASHDTIDTSLYGEVSPFEQNNKKENQTKFVYYKYYPIVNGKIEIELMDAPFSLRPNGKGFAGWTTDHDNVTFKFDKDIYTR